MATYCASHDPFAWFIAKARRILLSACTVALGSCGGAGYLALLVGIGGCGGGTDTSPPSSTPPPAAVTTQPTGPAHLVVGTALSIDGGTSGNPVNLRVARSANGDGFVVWQDGDGPPYKLWANRYTAATAAWGNPINIGATTADLADIAQYDLTVDASGNATVAWLEQARDGNAGGAMSVRFDSGAGAWTPQVRLAGRGVPRLASDATGAVLAVYGPGARGRFFDPVSGAWQPEAQIEQSTLTTGGNFDPLPAMDGNGNALVVFKHLFPGEWFLASNYFSRTTGRWGQLPPDAENTILGTVPGSLIFGFIEDVQLAASTGGDFLVAWRATEEDSGRDMIRIAHFTGRTQKWDMASTLVPPARRVLIVLERIASDAMGNALVLWTEFDGTQRSLKTVRVDRTGATCSPVQVIDRAGGGGTVQADLAVDPLGNAIAIWQQFEGGRTDVGSRSNIAISRFDHATGAWTGAALAETQPGNAIGPRASAAGGQALLGWIQAEGGVNRVKALLQPIDEAGR